MQKHLNGWASERANDTNDKRVLICLEPNCSFWNWYDPNVLMCMCWLNWLNYSRVFTESRSQNCDHIIAVQRPKENGGVLPPFFVYVPRTLISSTFNLIIIPLSSWLYYIINILFFIIKFAPFFNFYKTSYTNTLSNLFLKQNYMCINFV